MNLATMNPGEAGRTTAVAATGPLRRRFMDMGVLAGEVVRVVKVAPLGAPIEIVVKGYRLSLRRREAEGIAVEVTA